MKLVIKIEFDDSNSTFITVNYESKEILQLYLINLLENNNDKVFDIFSYTISRENLKDIMYNNIFTLDEWFELNKYEI